MRFRLKQSIAALALAFLGVFAFATPVQADHDGHCGGGEACLYYSGSFSGGLADFGGDIANYTNYSFFHCSASNCRLNDNAASIRNLSSFITVDFCVDSWFRGGEVGLDPLTSMNGTQLGGWRNRFSSHYWF